ncbi:hypothetical protein [Caulobacter endophyticus]|nr:hypothetical protein [Caulobacter endophyticus]
MPARSRPTARLLTPTGWAGLAVAAALAAALAFIVLALLPRA